MSAAALFSNLGHLLMHMMAAYYFVVALAIERDWGQSYAALIELWALGALLVGAMALPAGWLADRWSASGMMRVFFLGMGAATIGCALARTPTELWIALTALGAFAGIYHPVGTAWLVRHAASPGRALGINGTFGSLGVASAGLVAGGLTDLAGWRVAFLVPGVATVATGLALAWWERTGRLAEASVEPPLAPAARPDERLRAFAILLVTMFSGAVIYQATQAAMPKLFAVRLVSLAGGGTFGVGALVGAVYLVAALTQLAAGTLADRFALKAVYSLAFLAQVPLLGLVALVTGPPLVATVAAAVVANVGSLPAENVLLAAATPSRRHGLAFGVKFVLSFGAAPVAIQLVSFATARYGDPAALFPWLAALAALTSGLALLIPAPRTEPRVAVPLSLEPDRLGPM